MHWIPIALGSLFAYAGRAWFAWHVPVLLPRWWVMTGELALAGVPALLGLYGPGWAGMLWFLTGLACFVSGVLVVRYARSTSRATTLWSDLSASATLGTDQADPVERVLLRRIRRMADADPEVAAFIQRLEAPGA